MSCNNEDMGLASGRFHIADAGAKLLFPGQRVGNRFEVIGRLGEGGAATVYRVTDREDGGVYALKAMNPSYEAAENVTRFVREYRVASRLKDPRLVRAYHFLTQDSLLFFTMDLVPGGALADYTEGRKLPVGMAVGLVLQTLSALDYLNSRNIVHRDIKPRNLLLSEPLPSIDDPPSGASIPLPRVRLTDFGISKVGDLSDDMSVGRYMGTPGYLAPEVAAYGISDPRADLYAVGILLYSLLLGAHPLEGSGRTLMAMRDYLRGSAELDTLSNLPGEVSGEIRSVIHDLISRDPSARPRTAALVYDRLWRWWNETKPPYTIPEQPPLSGSPYLAAAPLVGRSEELEVTRRFFHDLVTAAPLARGNQLGIDDRRKLLCPSVLVISGMPGVGKSRLTWQVLREAQRYDAQLLIGQCKREVDQPYEVMAAILKRLEAIQSSSTAATASTSISGREETSKTTPLLEDGGSRDGDFWIRIAQSDDPEYELLKREPKDGVEVIKQNELRHQLIKERTASHLLQFAQHRLVVVVVEDLQWADVSTMNLLAHVMRSTALARGQGYEGKLAFVLTHRTSTADEPLTALQETLVQQAVLEQAPVCRTLRPLLPEHSAELAAALLMEPPSEPFRQFCKVLMGNRTPTPLYVEQVLRQLLFDGQLTQGQFDAQGRWLGRWNLDPSLAERAKIPATVQEAIGERSTRLSVQTQSLLACASAVGRCFSVELLSHLNGLHENEVLDSLDEASEEAFIQPFDLNDPVETGEVQPRTYRFVHDRYREAIYERMDATIVRELHLRIGTSIAALSADPAEVADSLAHHYALGGYNANAYHFGLLAADNALRRGIYDRAATLYRDALTAAQHAHIIVEPAVNERYADACVAIGQFEIAEAQYALRITSLPPGQERRDVQRRAAELNYRRHEFENAAAPLETLLAEMGYPSPRSKLGIIIKFSLGSWRIPVTIVASYFLRYYADRQAKDPDHLDLLGRVRLMLTECWVFKDWRRCLYHGLQFISTAFFAGNFPFRPALVAAAAFSWPSFGLYGTARRMARFAESILRQDTDPNTKANTYYLLVWASVYRGEPQPDLIAPALRAAEASGDIHRRYLARLSTWTLLYFSGRIGAARTLARSMRELGQRFDLPPFAGWGQYLEGLPLRLCGDSEGALAHYGPATRILERCGDHLGVVYLKSNTLLALSLHPEPIPEERLLAAVEEGFEVISSLNGLLPGTCERGWCLVAMAICLARLPKAPPPLVRKVHSLWRKMRRFCRIQYLETPVYLAAGAALLKVRGKPKQAAKRLQRALLLAERRRNFDAQTIIYRLAGWILERDSGELARYSRRNAELIMFMTKIPGPSFESLLKGELGANLLDLRSQDDLPAIASSPL